DSKAGNHGKQRLSSQFRFRVQRTRSKCLWIEATIGHIKTDARLDRNFLLGHNGVAINALLVAAGHNLGQILKAIALWRAYILADLTALAVKLAIIRHYGAVATNLIKGSRHLEVG
ncbi:transposase, partial [Rhizobium ruizarguesonis]